MSSPTSPPLPSQQPPLVSLVLQSKKALQHGEALCSRANDLSNASAQCAVDVLELDAKVRWIGGAVGEQLKVSKNLWLCLYGEKWMLMGLLLVVGCECS